MFEKQVMYGPQQLNASFLGVKFYPGDLDLLHGKVAISIYHQGFCNLTWGRIHLTPHLLFYSFKTCYISQITYTQSFSYICNLFGFSYFNTFIILFSVSQHLILASHTYIYAFLDNNDMAKYYILLKKKKKRGQLDGYYVTRWNQICTQLISS